MKKTFKTILSLLISFALFTGCGNQGDVSEKAFNPPKSIHVVSREAGSGTRGAFIDLFGIEVKKDDGTIKDMTTVESDIVNKTGVTLTSVTSDYYGIGYASLGSMNDSVKAIKIDGVKPTAENVKSGKYKILRPFIIATKGEPTEITKDFIAFILSKEGQAVVSKSYVSVSDEFQDYGGNMPSGKIVISGSSSVTPIMERLTEAYKAINPNAVIEIQMSDSSSGMTGAMDGTCDIGMASRDLKEKEKAELNSIEIAIDAITVIVNNNNPIDNMTVEQVNSIFTGNTLKWNNIQ